MATRVHLQEDESESQDGIPTGRTFYYAACGLDYPEWANEVLDDDPTNVTCRKCKKWMKENGVERVETTSEATQDE